MHQPTRDQLARLSVATVREMHAHAAVARAQADHGEALTEVHSATSAVLYGEPADEHDVTESVNGHGQTGHRELTSAMIEYALLPTMPNPALREAAAASVLALLNQSPGTR